MILEKRYPLSFSREVISSSRSVRKSHMRCRNQLIAMFSIGLVLGRAKASPTQVERDPPRKEPVYQRSPYYCLLVSGFQKKQATGRRK